METATTTAAALEPRQIESHKGSHAPVVGRDVHARLAGTRPNQDADLPPFWGEDGFSFDDLVDLVNPLHHIPLVGSVYRALTGDQIAAGPRILGGALFAGGPVGAAVAAAGNAVNASIAHDTGKDIGGRVLAFLGIGGGADTPAPRAAAAQVAEIDGLPWLPPTAAASPAPPAAETVAAVSPAPRNVAPLAATTAATQPNLSDQQWAMLVASLEPQEITRAEPRPVEPTARPAPAQQPADIAAAMARALDKYEALTRARALDELIE